ncbi:hypothetical protein HY251_22010, partial [bacterium]|nr:hypothetical protein [bacterium]
MSTGMGSPLRARRERERGAVLLVALGVLALLAAFAAAFFGLVNVERRAAQNYTDTVRARLVARAGLERAKVQLRDLAGQRSYSSIYPIAYVPPPPPGGPPARTLPPGVDAWGYAYTDPSGVPETDPDGNPSSSWKSTLLATERRSLATTSTPSYAVNSGRAIPGLPGPRFLIYSGKQGETYANGADVYRLKILDAASQINLNHPDRLSLQRMLRNLIRSRFSRFQGDPAAANRLAQKIVEGRPTSGYAAKGDLDAILVSDSAPGSKDWLGPDEWLELRDDLTVHSWVDEKVIRPWALNNEKDLGPLDVASDGSTLAEAPVRG